MALLKSIIAENVQEHLRRADWNAAIREMEKLFSIDQNPLIRVRIGDMRRKLHRKREAMWEYVLAADLFAEEGSVHKALAQYRLALQFDPLNTVIRSRMERVRRSAPVVRPQREPGEYCVPQPTKNELPPISMPDNRCRQGRPARRLLEEDYHEGKECQALGDLDPARGL
jgi:hypothetical protein